MRGTKLQYPVLLVSINGSLVDRRPTDFFLTTNRLCPAVEARLLYPADAPSGDSGDEITVSLGSDGNTYLLFTGTIYDAKTRGRHRELSLTDGYKNLCDTLVMPAYRKEKASVILQDTLEASGITAPLTTCPEITLNRFSTERITADRCIQVLIHALSEYGETGFRYFFDAKNKFHCGKYGDTGKNEGPLFSFERGKYIIERGAGWVEVLPLPLRHSQALTVDGVDMKTIFTKMAISRRISRLTLWLEEDQ
jgi:hypothetical protein